VRTFRPCRDDECVGDDNDGGGDDVDETDWLW
jgi:hypothetical protein